MQLLTLPNDAFNIILKPRIIDKNYNVFYTVEGSKRQTLLMANVSYEDALNAICEHYDKKA